MNDDVDSVQSSSEAVRVSDITYEIAHALVVETSLLHLVLLELVPAEHDELLGVIISEHHFCELLPEGARTTGHQYYFLSPFHSASPRW